MRPWALTAQAPKIEGGQFHGEAAWMVQLSPCKPGCEVNCQGVQHRRFVLCRGQPDSGESCIMLQSWLTCSLVAKFLQRSVVTCSTQISCCRERTLRTRPRTSVCQPLMPDVVASKAQSQLCELSGSTFEFNAQEFSMVGGYIENLEKPQNCQNWGVGACSGVGACLGQYGIFTCICVKGFSNHWIAGIWNGAAEWKMKWNGKCTQL